ncbi:hypothetical protein Ciccas_005490 [Cichlidogyrus casuarinus]|uniref:Uncharacterized protein n=1 Tax=Cichlidogyrus casuarinus TaxID=1844966 RepID=A0ABD2Q9G6_9PLAT
MCRCWKNSFVFEQLRTQQYQKAHQTIQLICDRIVKTIENDEQIKSSIVEIRNVVNTEIDKMVEDLEFEKLLLRQGNHYNMEYRTFEGPFKLLSKGQRCLVFLKFHVEMWRIQVSYKLFTPGNLTQVKRFIEEFDQFWSIFLKILSPRNSQLAMLRNLALPVNLKNASKVERCMEFLKEYNYKHDQNTVHRFFQNLYMIFCCDCDPWDLS